MKNLFACLMIFWTSISYTQNINLVLSTTDEDSLEYHKIKITIDTIIGEFYISNYENYIATGSLSLVEYKGKLIDIDSIHIATDGKKTICGLRFYSCQHSFYESRLSLSTYIIDNPKMIDQISLGYWKIKNELELIAISKSINKYIRKEKKCVLPNIKELMAFGNDYTQYGIESVYYKGERAKSRVIEESLRQEIKNCFGPNELDSINLVYLELNFEKDSVAKVKNMFFYNSKFGLDEALNSRISKCISNFKGWYVDRTIPAYRLKLCYLFSMKSENLEQQAMYEFDQIKIKSEKRKIISETHKSKFTQAQKDSMMVSSFEDVISSAFGIENKENQIFNVVEKMPILKDKQFFENIKQKVALKFPDRKLDFVIQFVVNKNGSVNNPTYLRCSDTEICDFVISFLKNSEQIYIPGEQRGRQVSVQVTQRFKN